MVAELFFASEIVIPNYELSLSGLKTALLLEFILKSPLKSILIPTSFPLNAGIAVKVEKLKVIAVSSPLKGFVEKRLIEVSSLGISSYLNS